jgi:hypothetical protein
MSDIKISCVLITRQREYPKIIMERLETGFFDEILITTESPSIYERYLLAKTARNEIIFVQDDDTLINYQVLFSKYDGRITSALPKNRMADCEALKISLIGWGCFFPKSALSVFDKYIEKYGIDAHLLREADRIFTRLNYPLNIVEQPHEDLSHANSATSMWKEAEHFSSRDEALKKCELILAPI